MLVGLVILLWLVVDVISGIKQVQMMNIFYINDEDGSNNKNKRQLKTGEN